MKIALAQLDPVVGAFDSNFEKIKKAFNNACKENARILVTPELSICGYPPHDLVYRPEIFDRCKRTLDRLQELTQGQKCALVVGLVTPNSKESGRRAQNTVVVIEDGKEVFRQAKSLLPTYDVFDEARYFEPAKEIQVWNCDGKKVAIAICEDLWSRENPMRRDLYGTNPIEQYRKLNIDLLISVSASPYIQGKSSLREELHTSIAKSLDVPLVYVNQTGATDEILFDGGSFAVSQSSSDWNFLGRLPFFKVSFGLLDWDGGKKLEWQGEVPDQTSLLDGLGVLVKGLECGIREYFVRTKFKKAVIGLSGGIDSAVVACLATQALGKENVLGISMPSQFSSGHSMEDADLLAKNLGIQFEVIPIKFFYSVFRKELTHAGRQQIAPLAEENLQARLRGIVLMTLSNHYSALVLTTGNKSELATGYCTLYGDMVGALGPIGDLFKTQVYEVAHKMNELYGNPIPKRCIEKEPSAELKPDQRDQDSLPPYEALDPVLSAYIEDRRSLEEIETEFGNQNWIRPVLRTVELAEYKRLQAAPVLKVSPKAFGVGRRIPVAKAWDSGP